MKLNGQYNCSCAAYPLPLVHGRLRSALGNVIEKLAEKSTNPKKATVSQLSEYLKLLHVNTVRQNMVLRSDMIVLRMLRRR